MLTQQSAHVRSQVAVPEKVPPVDRDSEPAILPFILTNKQYRVYRQRLWERDHRCRYCHKPVNIEQATLDHVTPQSREGLDEPSNLILSCERCNNLKAARSAVEWASDIVKDAQKSIEWAAEILAVVNGPDQSLAVMEGGVA